MRFLLAVLLLASAAVAQSELSGVVRDPAGLPVAGAAISVESQATAAQFATLTGSDGAYRLLGLPAGEYSFAADRPGFRPYRRSGVLLRAADRRTFDLQLEVAGLRSDTIDVVGDAPLLETATAAVGYSVDRAKLASVPLDGRNFVPLIALSPGVALPGGGSLLPRINGSRPRTNEYLYDGVSVLQPEPGQVAFYPVLDAVDEFRLNINAY